MKCFCPVLWLRVATADEMLSPSCVLIANDQYQSFIHLLVLSLSLISTVPYGVGVDHTSVAR